MVSRLRRARALAAVLFLSGIITVACQKVPLLAPSGSTITLTASATALPPGGTADIIAQVIEAAGTPPHEGTRVTFTTNLGTIQPSEAETDISGRAIVKFVAGTASGTATITAISGGVSVAAANVVKIQVGAAAVGSISVSAAPATLPNTGGTSTIVATVSDISGNPLPGVPVTFAIDTATGSSGAGSLSATVALTDASGRAQVTLTTNRTTTVSASAGIGAATGTPPTGGTQTGKVTVTVNTTTTIAIGAPSPAAPIAGQTVTLPLTYGTAATASPIVRLTVDWGDSSVQTFTGQPAAISHTYRGAGSYLVVVTGVDALGDVSTTTAAVTVAARPGLVVTVTPSDNPQPNAVTTFTIAATPSTGNAITSIAVDFGDGSPQVTLSGNATRVQHVYSTGGTYLVTVIATDSGGNTGSGSTVVAIGTGTTANFTVTGTVVNRPTFFNASVSSPPTRGATIVTYLWDFGDGHTASSDSPTQTNTYTLATTYPVTLTVTDSMGGRSTATKFVTITAQ